MNDDGTVVPCEACERADDSIMESYASPRVSDENWFGHLAHHILPRPTSYERAVIAEIASRYAGTDLNTLEVAVKRDPAWKLSSEGQLMDYEYVFYREDEQEAPDNEE